jgi:hypothetical protein
LEKQKFGHEASTNIIKAFNRGLQDGRITKFLSDLGVQDEHKVREDMEKSGFADQVVLFIAKYHPEWN